MEMYSSSSTSSLLFQEFLRNLNSRKLLQYEPLYQPDVPAASPSVETAGVGRSRSFQQDVVFVLSVFVCVVVGAMVMISIIKSVLKCSGFLYAGSGANLANKGVKRNVLKNFPVVKYTDDDRGELPASVDKECVCLSEFAFGESVRVLPKCNHGFHVLCVDKWLTSHSSCPTCRDNVSSFKGQPSSSVVPSLSETV